MKVIPPEALAAFAHEGSVRQTASEVSAMLLQGWEGAAAIAAVGGATRLVSRTGEFNRTQIVESSTSTVLRPISSSSAN
jgi:hypothetical protein